MALTTIPVELVTLDDGVTITVDDNSDNLTLTSTDTDANSGPNLKLDRAVTGADDDLLGGITFAGQDDANNSTDYASMQVHLKDASNGAEDGLIDFQVMSAGTSRSFLILNGGGTVIVNQDSQDVDFRVESNNDGNCLFVDGGNDAVGIGTGSPTSPNSVNRFLHIHNADHSSLVMSDDQNTWEIVSNNDLTIRDGTDTRLTVSNGGGVTITRADNGVCLNLKSTDTDASIGPILDLTRDNASAADGDVTGAIRFKADDSVNNETTYAQLVSKITDQSNGTEDGSFHIETIVSGSTTEVMSFVGGLVFIGKTASSLANTGIEIHQNGIMYATSTDNPQAYFNRETSHGVQLQGRKDNSNVWSISSNGTNFASDRNFKKDITELQLGLDFVKELKPKTFRFKMDKETDPLMTGLIAQDLEQSLTDAGVEKNSMTLVQHEPQEDQSESQYVVDYSKLIPVLIKGMQEQQTLIETLQTKVKALEEA